MYKDYQDAILRCYEQKRVNNELSSPLLNPTPSKLRDECAFIYQSRFEKPDQKMLSSFFEVPDGSNILKAIEGIDIDKFRPLVNFLKEATGKTEDKNIELLGWLLDFQPRPYVMGHNYGNGKIINPRNTSRTDGGLDNGTADGEGLPTPFRLLPKFRSFIQHIYEWLGRGRLGLRAGGLALLGVITAIYFNNKESAFGNAIFDNRGCMIWTGDYYEQVSCDSTGIVGLVLPLDKNRLKNLRRITKPDTLTKKHIGNVWYRKRGGDSLDFFTAGGKDPVDLNGNLHPLSAYIFDKYLDKTSSSDSSSSRSLLSKRFE